MSATAIQPESATAQTLLDPLQSAIYDMDSLSQNGFSEISSIAKHALAMLETPDGYRHPETIANALRAIWGKADDIESCIRCRAEEVGCCYQDPKAERRYAAHRAALKEARRA